MASTGRGVSGSIVRSLREALAGGAALTYQELARAAVCTQRTVRNYIDDAEGALGFRIVRVRGSDHAMRVRRRDDAVEPVRVDHLALAVAGEILRNVFPIAGTNLDAARSSGDGRIVVSIRDVYEYGERHLRILRKWLQLASTQPTRAVRFNYDGAESGTGERIAWPLGVVLRDAARVYLAGVPVEARDGRDVRTYALESISSSLDVVDQKATGQPPLRFTQANISEAIDAPFSMFRPSADRAVSVRVAFGPHEARYVVARRWHRRQRITKTDDGGVVLELGPADRGEVEAWLRGWGDGANLLEMRPARKARSSSKT